MGSEKKDCSTTHANDGAGRRHTDPVTTTRSQGQTDTSDARLKEIIARAVEKVKRPATVDDKTTTYPPPIAPFEKKARPKGREGSR
jgi:hypothetical protein